MPTPEGATYNRREILELLGLGGTVLGGALLGFGTHRLIHNETPHQYPIDESVLIDLTGQRDNQPWFGLYPDFERGTDPWAEVEKAAKHIAPVKYVGHFATLQTFVDSGQTDALLDQLEQARQRGSVPVVSLGVNFPDFDKRYHVFHQRNRPIIAKGAKLAAQALDRHAGKLVVRIFYEANMPQWSFGPKPTFGGRQHQEGFKQAFAITAASLANRRHPTLMAFSPSAEFPVGGYYPQQRGQPLPDIAGLDGYDLYPGSGQILNPNYWVYGWRSPEKLFLPGLNELFQRGKGKVPVVYWEIGSLTRDPDWLRHAALLLLAVGGSGLMHFNYDKSYQQLPWEANWKLNRELNLAYRQALHPDEIR